MRGGVKEVKLIGDEVANELELRGANCYSVSHHIRTPIPASP